MKVAVVGEGPVGLVTLAKLIALDGDNKCDITWFRRSGDYTRRHIVELTKNTVSSLEDILQECVGCIGKTEGDHKLSISIRRLEKQLSDGLPKGRFETKGKFEDSHAKDFDHVFLANGFSSPNRLALVYNGIDYTQLKYVDDTPILIFYSNLGPLKLDPISSDDADESSYKTYIPSNKLFEHGLTIHQVSSLISLVYRLYLFGEDFTITKQNLWIAGFESIGDFENTFEMAFKSYKNYLQGNTIGDVNDIFVKNKANALRHDEIQILESIQDGEGSPLHWDNYLSFIKLTCHDECGRFLVHTVVPNITSFGSILDGELKYANSKQYNGRDVSIWLVGDSANSFPPGFSLEIGVKTILDFLPTFYKHIISNGNKVLDHCPFDNVKLEVPPGCDTSAYLFKGGYTITNGVDNDTVRNIRDIFTMIKNNNITCNNDNLIDYYNKKQFMHFMENVVKIKCDYHFDSALVKGGGSARRTNGKNSMILVFTILLSALSTFV
jgi:hypothetical protein